MGEESQETSGGERARVLIEPSRGWPRLRLGDLWAYRELLYFLVWRNVKVRYKQTFFGVAWAVLQPLLSMVVFTVFFGVLARIPSEGVPYALFALCGLLPWQLFANALSTSSASLVAGEALIKKIYFPRLVVPLASVLEGLPDFLVALALLAGMMAYYGVVPTVALAALPLFVLLALTTAFAFGTWLSALNVVYRDVRYAVPFLLQIWLFATPVVYPASLVPESWRALYGLNPMAAVVEGFRWALLGAGDPPGAMLFVAVSVTAVVLVGGLAYFRWMERTVADVL